MTNFSPDIWLLILAKNIWYEYDTKPTCRPKMQRYDIVMQDHNWNTKFFNLVFVLEYYHICTQASVSKTLQELWRVSRQISLIVVNWGSQVSEMSTCSQEFPSSSNILSQLSNFFKRVVRLFSKKKMPQVSKLSKLYLYLYFR